VTFGTLAPRAVIKDVGRVLGVPLSVVNSITEKIPVVQGKVTPIVDALQLPDLRWVRDTSDPKIKEMIEIATVLEGFARNASTHAAGVVITPGPVTDYVPIYKSAGQDSAESTMYTMKDLEDAGLLKMDFLGLATLSIIDRTIEQVRDNYGTVIDIDAIDFDDAAVYAMLAQGRTMAVFQFESDKMTEYLRLLAPKNLEELTAMNALYRPGPMDSIPEFIARKHGKKPITYIHPLMEQRLKNTYGVIAYQEQVMQLVQDLAGFTLAEADMMRRAMGKKDAAAMAAQRSVFVKGAHDHQDIDAKTAEQIFDLFQKFSQYGFNKSHSAAYSYLAYQTAWLKHHHTAEFLAANMTNDLSDLARISSLMEEAKKFDIRVLPPDVNKSGVTFRAVDPKTVLFGMAGIKMVGIAMVEGILRARKDGPFTSLYDFVARVEQNVLNKRALEALIAAGAFDSLECGHRAQLYAAVDQALDWARKMSTQQAVNMDSLFGDTGNVMVVEPRLPDVERWTEKERLEKEYEVLNFYISGHPLQRYIVQLTSFSSNQLGRTETITTGKNVRVGGLISSVRLRFDKKEKQIAFAVIEDMTGKGEVILWSEAYAQFRELVYEGSAVLVTGKAEVRDDGQLKITAEDITPLEHALRKFTRGYKLRIDADADAEKLAQVRELCVPGATKGIPVTFHVVRNGEQVASYHAPDVTLPVDDPTVKRLTEILGSANIRLSMSS
ncbi:MAG: DNA polymerase III subunit alpha, partial [Candidatus Kapaibacterium sp.]